MRDLTACLLFLIIAVTIPACSSKRQPSSSESDQPARSVAKDSSAKPETTPAQTQAGDLQTGQASGSYTAKGEVVELKYAYAGRAQRFSTDSLIILLTDKPIPPEAVAEEIKSTPLLEGEKIRGLEYAIDENGMWVRYHPSQYQESGRNTIKDYKIDNEVVKGVDENEASNGKYSRSVRFVAAIAK